jgi:hypothetical protein
VLDVDGLGPTLFCHGSPRDDEELLTTLTPERRWRPALEGVGEAVVCGHTHAQFDRRLGRWQVVNAGAVGLPYEGRAGAYWLLLGPDVEHRRTDYDLDSAVAAMRAAGNPDTDELLRDSLVKPMDPCNVAQLLERQAERPLVAAKAAGSPPARERQVRVRKALPLRGERREWAVAAGLCPWRSPRPGGLAARSVVVFRRGWGRTDGLPGPCPRQLGPRTRRGR